MGACSSCLGDRRHELSDEDDNSRLLYEDGHANQYGTFGDQNAGNIQADPEEIQRENEALQKVVIQTSNHLVDIFAVASEDPAPPSSAIFSGQDARLLRYRDVLAKLSTNDSSNPKGPSFEGPSNVSDGWVSGDDDMEEIKPYALAKSDDVGPLLGGFADDKPATE